MFSFLYIKHFTGVFSFNNDLQNITIIPSLRLLKNTLTLSGNVGFQRNNLDNLRASTTKRFAGAVNANYLPNEKWNFTTSYSNFSSFTNMRPQVDPNFQNNLDTLNFYQISENMMAGLVRTLGKKDSPKSIMLNISYQEANNESGYEGGDQTSAFLSANVAYNHSIAPSNMVLSVTANVYSTNTAGIKSTFYGPTASITKSFFEKTLRGSWATSFNKTTGENVSTGSVLNNRFNLNFTPRGKESSSSRNNFSLSINVLRRLQESETQPSFTEFTGTINYSYTF